MPETITPSIAQLSGTARPVGAMRAVFGNREHEVYQGIAAKLEWALKDGTISQEQYEKLREALIPKER